MVYASDRRWFARYENYQTTVTVSAPSLSEDVFVPENVGVGGIRLFLSRELQLDDFCEFSINVAGEVFEGAKGIVTWKRPVLRGTEETPSWNVGFLLQLEDEQRIRFRQTLERTFSERFRPFGKSDKLPPQETA